MYVFGRPSDSIIRCLEDYFRPVLDIKNNFLYAHPQKHQTSTYLSPKNLQININEQTKTSTTTTSTNQPNKPWPKQRWPPTRSDHITATKATSFISFGCYAANTIARLEVMPVDCTVRRDVYQHRALSTSTSINPTIRYLFTSTNCVSARVCHIS